MIIAFSVLLICVLLFAGISVPLAFGGVLIFLAYTGGHDVSGFMPTGHWKLNTVVILVIPLFILAGDIMKNGRIAAPIVDLAEMLLGRIRGGLSGASVVASAMFGAISGSGAATLTCIGAVMMPHLRRAKYPEGFSAALLVAASPLGLLIPPSSAQLIYAWLTQQSVLKCFLATVLPGIIVASLLVIINLIMMRKQTDIVLPEHQEQFVKAFSKKSLAAFPALMMPIIILGGIYGGIMTPTEAAGVAVIYAIPIGFFVYKGLNWKIFMDTLKESSVTIGVVMVMIFMVLIVSRFLIFEDIPGLAQDLIFSISDNPVVVLLMINLTMILIGMIMDDFSGLILSATLLLPIATSVGVDPIHFAAILGVNLGMGNITPPTAPLLFLGARVTGAPVQKMLGPTMIFIIFAWLPTLALTTFVPGVALWLPELLLG
ncbi:TRAP transporter large permease [Roseovarius rhodophyticola]|uniref:TRAP transporter large permease protein n=1 Tax=Roseovarius rhodophyticola TaxID=3080827 RepID=A0ABZ2TLY7_9RHOB|nr:TRAP transporter large permease [Roseovarius sp. W115]MDV2927947.1 TRAP transporter large permease [Roseovarius sp. W115]